MERLAGVIEEQLVKGVVGAAVAIVVDDEIVWSGGYGVVDIDDPAPVSPSTTFSAQSLTKPVVATALMRFVEDGVIGLDDPVNAHLGEVRLANAWEDEYPVTIRQLLTHTGGLGVSASWHSTVSVEDEVATHVSTEAAPGSRLVYANNGYDTLGCLLAQLAGAAWDEAVTQGVFVPLEMTATRIGAPHAGHEDRAVGHAPSQMDGRVLRLATVPWPSSLRRRRDRWCRRPRIWRASCWLTSTAAAGSLGSRRRPTCIGSTRRSGPGEGAWAWASGSTGAAVAPSSATAATASGSRTSSAPIPMSGWEPLSC